MSCFKFGPRGVTTEPADPLPLVPQNEKIEDDDDDDDDDEDDFGLTADDDDDDDDEDDDDDGLYFLNITLIVVIPTEILGITFILVNLESNLDRLKLTYFDKQASTEITLKSRNSFCFC